MWPFPGSNQDSPWATSNASLSLRSGCCLHCPRRLRVSLAVCPCEDLGQVTSATPESVLKSQPEPGVHNPKMTFGALRQQCKQSGARAPPVGSRLLTPRGGRTSPEMPWEEPFPLPPCGAALGAAPPGRGR